MKSIILNLESKKKSGTLPEPERSKIWTSEVIIQVEGPLPW